MRRGTAGYLVFASVCVAGATTLVVSSMGTRPDESPPPDALQLVTAPKKAQLPEPPRAAVAKPMVVKPVMAAETPRSVAVKEKPKPIVPPAMAEVAVNKILSRVLPSSADGSVYGQAQPCDHPLPRRTEPLDRPLLLPPRLARGAPAAFTLASPRLAYGAAPGNRDIPRLATDGFPLPPPAPQLATMPRYSAPTIEPVLPPLRVPLVVRPRPEPMSLQGHPSMDDHGGISMPELPVFRTTPVPPDATGNVEQCAPSFEHQPDDDPPAAVAGPQRHITLPTTK